jgi:hypothetical protein
MSGHPLDGEAITASLADPPAFGVIFERHFSAIHGYLRRRLDRQLADPEEDPEEWRGYEAGLTIRDVAYLQSKVVDSTNETD